MSIDDRLLLALAVVAKRRLTTGDPVACQERLVASLVRHGANTAFGRQHHFASIRCSRDFFNRVPAKNYENMRVSIAAILDGDSHVLFQGKPHCFGVTTGTEGERKLIPFNSALLRSTRWSAIEAALLGGLRCGSFAWYRGKTLYVGPRKGRLLGKWVVYAEGTAFAYLQAKPLTARFVPRYENLPEDGQPQDWAFLRREARQHTIRAVAGNPLEITAFVLAEHVVMPEVRIVFNCGYWAMDLLHIYGQAFPNAEVVDVFSSNEGTFGLPLEPGHFLLNYRRIFFGFLPLGSGSKVLGLAETQVGQKYLLCVTTPGGLWNYVTGDAVELLSLKPPTIRLCGRAARVLSLAGEQVTENEVVAAVRRAGLKNMDYCMTAGRNGYILRLPGDRASGEAVDLELQDLNRRYRRLRSSARLETIKVDSDPRRNPEGGKPARILSQ